MQSCCIQQQLLHSTFVMLFQARGISHFSLFFRRWWNACHACTIVLCLGHSKTFLCSVDCFGSLSLLHDEDVFLCKIVHRTFLLPSEFILVQLSEVTSFILSQKLRAQGRGTPCLLHAHVTEAGTEPSKQEVQGKYANC